MIAGPLAAVRRTRQIGPRVVARKIGIRCWSTRVSIFLSRPIEPPLEESADLAIHYSIIAPDALDVRDLSLESLHGADLLYVEGILKVHRRCPGDLIIGRDANYALVVVGLLSYPDRRHALELAAPGLYPELQPDECWTEAFFVMPKFRSKRVMASTLSATRNYLASLGFQRLHAVISIDNISSLRAFARAGYRPTGTIRYERFRLNHFSSWFASIDEETRLRWERATSDLG